MERIALLSKQHIGSSEIYSCLSIDEQNQLVHPISALALKKKHCSILVLPCEVIRAIYFQAGSTQFLFHSLLYDSSIDRRSFQVFMDAKRVIQSVRTAFEVEGTARSL